MITNVLNSHKTTLFLTILFLVLLMLTYGVMRSSLLASDKGEQLPSDVVVSDPLGVTSGSSTDSLLAEENMDQLFSVIRAHLLPTEPLILPPD